jgi:hypothetical protein
VPAFVGIVGTCQPCGQYEFNISFAAATGQLGSGAVYNKEQFPKSLSGKSITITFEIFSARHELP